MQPASRIHHAFAVTVVLFMAVALQIQVTLFESEFYQGLRLSLADLVLPPAGFFILGSLFLKQSAWQRWQAPFGYGWLAALTLVMVYGLARFYFLHGEVLQWALINKFAGWFILMAYLGLGGWIAGRYPDALTGLWVRAFAVFFLLIGIVYSAAILLWWHKIYTFTDWPPLFNFVQIEGLMANRNSFAFLLAVTTLLVTITAVRSDRNLRFMSLFWFFAAWIFVLNGSRTLWLGLIPLLAFCFFLDRRVFLKRILPFALGGVLVCYLALPPGGQQFFMGRVGHIDNAYTLLTNSDHPGFASTGMAGDNWRLEILDLSFRKWLEHPVLGSGLGAIIHEQMKAGDLKAVLDNSALWLMTETGLIGFAVFIGCFIAMILSARKIMRSDDRGITDEKKALALFTIALLLTFGFFSIFHEILYTRFFWFFLGLGLALPAKQRPDG